MNFSEKGTFRGIIEKAAAKVAKTATADMVDAYYDYLKDYPIELLERAVNQAYRERDPEDIWLRTQMITSLEIEQSARLMMEEESRTEDARCSMCGGTRWIVENRIVEVETAGGKVKVEKPVAHPCKCLYDMVTEAMAKKGASTRKNYRYLRIIAKSYEAYQRR